MKQLYFIFVVVLCMATGCGSKKDASGDSDQHIFQIDSVDRVTGVQRMQVSRTNQDIVCNGKKYRLFIDRSPSDSLKKVKSDAGIFTDNRIVLKIARENGTTLFSKTFTKQNFASLIPDRYLTHSILEIMNMIGRKRGAIISGGNVDDEKTSNSKNIILAASVSIPMTDLYIPFSIIITPDGKMTMERDEDMGDLPSLQGNGIN